MLYILAIMAQLVHPIPFFAGIILGLVSMGVAEENTKAGGALFLLAILVCLASIHY